jgi:hypothetical protein
MSGFPSSLVTAYPQGLSSQGAPVLNPSIFSPAGKVWYVNGNSGNNGNTGTSADDAFRTMARAFVFVRSLDTIVLIGQVREELTAPLGVSSVTIYGGSTRPRYGNESSFTTPANDYAAAWRPPASPTAATPLLILRQQGWRFINLLFDCPVDAAGVQLRRQEDATYPDPSSASFIGCQFSDGKWGIQDVGGCYNIYIGGCSFRRISTAAIANTSTGVAVPLQNVIEYNTFEDCLGGIVGSYNQGTIQGNIFIQGPTYTFTTVINTIANAAQGSHNMVINNYTFDANADIDPAHGYTGSATDIWRTFTKDQADPVITSPPV